MREIKFRAWVPKGYTRWGGGGLVMLSWEDLLDDLHSEINPRKSVLGLGMSHTDQGVVFMQFTGLHDKNGKEIYEGDILRALVATDMDAVYHDTGAVEFHPEAAQFVLTKTREGHKMVTSIGNNVEVIGNIYENNDLLE